MLRQFKESFPQTLISIEPGDTVRAIDLLHRSEIDLAIMMEPINEPQLEFHGLFTDELSFIVAAGHPWAKDGHVNRADVPRQNYVLYNQGSYTFRAIQQYFREEEMVLNTVIELGSMDAIKELVKLGLGREHPRPMDRAKGTSGGLAGFAEPWPAQIETAVGRRSPARAAVEPRGGNVSHALQNDYGAVERPSGRQLRIEVYYLG